MRIKTGREPVGIAPDVLARLERSHPVERLAWAKYCINGCEDRLRSLLEYATDTERLATLEMVRDADALVDQTVRELGRYANYALDLWEAPNREAFRAGYMAHPDGRGGWYFNDNPLAGDREAEAWEAFTR
jgi:hypothetical protein